MGPRAARNYGRRSGRPFDQRPRRANNLYGTTSQHERTNSRRSFGDFAAKQVMLRIKRIYDKPAKEDGWGVLVDRLWPSGMKKEVAKIDLWMKEVAPTDALRKSFCDDVEKWPEFQKRYRAELKQKKELLAELKKIEKEHRTLTLLFGAKDTEHNQAVVLAEVLREK